MATQRNANPSYKLASIPRYDDTVRTAGWAGSARAAGGWLGVTGAFSKLRAVYGKWAWLARRWLAVDGGRSKHYCGSLDCGLPLMAFWQQQANAKCQRVVACTRSMHGYVYHTRVITGFV